MKSLLIVALLLPLPVFAQTFHGYPCTQDCAGHIAGYRWAQQRGIDDPDDCGGNSRSFIEGCQAAAEEEQSQSSDDDDEEESSY